LIFEKINGLKIERHIVPARASGLGSTALKQLNQDEVVIELL
jgi:hypothetical protein